MDTAQKRSNALIHRAFASENYSACAELVVKSLSHATVLHIQLLVNSLRRLGRAELVTPAAMQFLRAWQARPWDSALLHLTFGLAEFDSILTLADTEERRCAAHLSSGLRALSLGDLTVARTHLDIAAAIEVPIDERQVALSQRTLASPLDKLPVQNRIHLLSIEQELVSHARQYSEGVRLATRAYDLADQYFGDSADRVGAVTNLATALIAAGDPSGAEQYGRLAVTLSRRSGDHEDMQLAIALSTLGEILCRQSRLDEAIPLMRESLDLRTRLLGPRDDGGRRVAHRLIGVYVSAGQTTSAATLVQEQVALLESEEPERRAVGLFGLADVLAESGDRSEARRLRIDIAELAHQSEVSRQLVRANLYRLSAIEKDLGDHRSAAGRLTELLELSDAAEAPPDEYREGLLRELGVLY